MRDSYIFPFLATLIEMQARLEFFPVFSADEKMQVCFFIFLTVIAMAIAEKDEPWTWKDDDKQKESRAADARCVLESLLITII